MKNLIIRSLSGSIYVLLIVSSLILNKHLFAFVLFFFQLVGVYEFQCFGKFNRVFSLPVILGSLSFLLFHFMFLGYLPNKTGVLFLLIPLLIFGSGLFIKNRDVFEGLTFKFISLIYVTLPLILANFINIASDKPYSKLLFAVFILVWTNDSFAYLSGMAIGKHKLFERVSPKKTWEGLIGGIIGTLITAWLLRGFVGADNILMWELTAFIIALSAVLGDFIESLFKRSVGVKDSGKIMPGHGGILDRIDSLLFVFPVVYIYFQLTI